MPKFLDSLPMILSRSLDRVMPSYRRLFQANDLTDQQWRVLRALWEQQHLTSSEISQITLLPPPSLVGILDRLAKKPHWAPALYQRSPLCKYHPHPKGACLDGAYDAHGRSHS